MSKKNKKELRRAEKRKMEQIRMKKRNMKIVISFSFVLITIIAIVIFMSMSNGPDINVKNNEKTIDSNIASATELSIPLSEINNNAKFYSFDSDGVEIKYFAVKGSDGDVHVALDACDVCYDAKKGYIQVEDVMHCINCGREFKINNIGTDNTAGGCWPSYMPMNIKDNDLFISISDLEGKRYMFV